MAASPESLLVEEHPLHSLSIKWKISKYQHLPLIVEPLRELYREISCFLRWRPCGRQSVIPNNSRTSASLVEKEMASNMAASYVAWWEGEVWVSVANRPVWAESQWWRPGKSSHAPMSNSLFNK
ncbi:hypothetical protein AXF42_Ash002264 [Apostasia shenzhenica]|uniref:Uncharacterized protein n=1 Tax=Apostasia shenzhenica TaxID=1088818 RepID=A0A2I0AN24_9ASPA|nr:hypothetical protein AXF42_Ash002264 [Apostasia shenzhenica]